MKILNGVLSRPSPGTSWFSVYFPQLSIYLFIFYSQLLLHSSGRLLLMCCNAFPNKKAILYRATTWQAELGNLCQSQHRASGRCGKRAVGSTLYLCDNPWVICFLCQPRVARRHKWPWTPLSPLHPVRAYDAAHSLAATGSKDKR